MDFRLLHYWSIGGVASTQGCGHRSGITVNPRAILLCLKSRIFGNLLSLARILLDTQLVVDGVHYPLPGASHAPFMGPGGARAGRATDTAGAQSRSTEEKTYNQKKTKKNRFGNRK